MGLDFVRLEDTLRSQPTHLKAGDTICFRWSTRGYHHKGYCTVLSDFHWPSLAKPLTNAGYTFLTILKIFADAGLTSKGVDPDKPYTPVQDVWLGEEL